MAMTQSRRHSPPNSPASGQAGLFPRDTLASLAGDRGRRREERHLCPALECGDAGGDLSPGSSENMRRESSTMAAPRASRSSSSLVAMP